VDFGPRPRDRDDFGGISGHVLRHVGNDGKGGDDLEPAIIRRLFRLAASGKRKHDQGRRGGAQGGFHGYGSVKGSRRS